MSRFTVTLKLEIEATDLEDVEDIIGEMYATVSGIEDVTTEEIIEEE